LKGDPDFYVVELEQDQDQNTEVEDSYFYDSWGSDGSNGLRYELGSEGYEGLRNEQGSSFGEFYKIEKLFSEFTLVLFQYVASSFAIGLDLFNCLVLIYLFNIEVLSPLL
jgi:hypothetical protein